MKITIFRYSVFILLIGLFINTSSIAQENDASNYKMAFSFNTIKNHDNTRLLEVIFIGKNKKNRKDKKPIYDAEIEFFNILNDEEVLLGTAKTTKEGIAQLTLLENQNYLMDEAGNINLTARFEGTDALDEESEEILIKNLHLELNLTEIDSVKTVKVKAYTINSLGEEILVDEADIVISIEAMLSKMKIEEGTIEDGEFEFEFPTDIPGDVNGDITVYSIIEDNEDFGNVIQKGTINWGTFDKQIVKVENTLWSDFAPIWMYIVLTILLVGVWANYLYTIINLFKIKNEKKVRFHAKNYK